MRRGFTLLEVMISLAILAVALVALSDLNGGAVQMHAYARRSTQATLLLQAKMLDLEDLLQKEGPRDFDDERHGDFEGAAPGYTWRAEILRPAARLDDGVLLSSLGLGDRSKRGAPAAGLPGAALPGGAGAAGLLAAAGPFAGLLQGQVKTFLETLKKSVREVRVTVSWQDGKSARSVTAVQQLVVLPEMVGKEGQVQAAPPAAAPGVGGGVKR